MGLKLWTDGAWKGIDLSKCVSVGGNGFDEWGCGSRGQRALGAMVARWGSEGHLEVSLVDVSVGDA